MLKVHESVNKFLHLTTFLLLFRALVENVDQAQGHTWQQTTV